MLTPEEIEAEVKRVKVENPDEIYKQLRKTALEERKLRGGEING